MTDTKQAVEKLTELKAEFAATAAAFKDDQWLKFQYGHYQDAAQFAIDHISKADVAPARERLERLKSQFDFRAKVNKHTLDVIGMLLGVSAAEITRVSEEHSKKVGDVLKLI